MKGEIFYGAGYSITVADGWQAFPVSERVLQLRKSVGNKEFSQLYMQLNYSGEAYMLTPSKYGYYDITDYPCFTAGNFTWNGFSCDSMGFRVAMIWTGVGTHQFQISANLEAPEGKIDIFDEDIQAMLASIIVTK
ncbi:MAG: hypothetical protein IJ002_01330 [Clostridia bacterium]|nr:hypothetical protein [Clostridia bacterium]